ncbi:hypothetical protein QL285_092251 [Trifolium repens]|nr:hypothetical protein QL285_092251 [Trifolium repens]
MSPTQNEQRRRRSRRASHGGAQIQTATTASQNTDPVVTSRANPENEPKTTTHHRKSEHGGAGKQIKAVDLASIRAANRTPTGKGWCGRKDGEHHRSYHLHRVCNDLDFGEFLTVF